MLNKVVLLILIILFTCLKVANFASFIPDNRGTVLIPTDSQVDQITPNLHRTTTTTISYEMLPGKTTTSAQHNQTSIIPSPNSVPTPTTQTVLVTSLIPSISTTTDPNSDPEEAVSANTPNSNNQSPDSVIISQMPIEDPLSSNKTKTTSFTENQIASSSATTALTVLFYSLFLAYVSFTKLIYHNIGIIKRNMTEPGVLMIFGILWELVSRQFASNHNIFPKFNSRVFFYLFLPSTVLESASLLSNKWLFINMLSILVQSIFGTLFYASSLGFSIYSLSRQDIFNLNLQRNPHQSSAIVQANRSANFASETDMFRENLEGLDYQVPTSAAVESFSMELKNLTLADCLVFGTILSSIDSSTMLEVIRILQVNEKLYYLILGENLMNNAVVLVIFELLLDFFSTTRVTVVKIYMAILQFFSTLIGSVFIGFVLAVIALIAVRLTKRFQVCDIPSSYQYQCQAMVETLLILKLAYLTYNVADFASTSSILSLATFGIFQNQYIKHSLNLRSQLAFRQVVLATKTMGFSLVYPLLGMLLVEVTNSSQFFQTFSTFSDMSQSMKASSSNPLGIVNAASLATSKLSQFAEETNLYWNFKFLSAVTLLTIVFRFTVVFALSLFCNLFSSNQLKINFREQVLIAYGSLTGPLAFALVYKLFEHEEYRYKTIKNKHIYMYTILFIAFTSAIFKGSFIKPLVYKMKLAFQDGGETKGDFPIVLSEINCRVTEFVSHGLNSILGRTKSPYDKFAEFNEVHIKPRLTWRKSNINWLSVFYEDLILDEILNVNCSNRSNKTQSTSKLYEPASSIHSSISERQSKPVLRRKKVISLHTIDENGVLTRDTEQRSFIPIKPTNRIIKESHVANLGDSSLLKEFVLFNLKLEDARRRLGTLNKRAKSKVKPSIDDDTEQEPELPKLLSTTSSAESQEHTKSSLELLNYEKQRHLYEIERRLSAIHQDKSVDYKMIRLERKRRRRPIVSRERLTSKQNLLPGDQVANN